MVDLKPFSGVRYNQKLAGDLAGVVSPPHDVIGKEEQNNLYDSSPYNIVRLILGKSLPGDGEDSNQYTRASELLAEWIDEGILVRDREPAIYAYEQEFSLDNGVRKKQLGFIGLVRLEPFEKGVILPHERIISKMKEDRLNLMKECHANMSLIITAYSDKEGVTSKLLSEGAANEPEIEVSFDGVVHRIWMISDPHVLKTFREFFADKKLYIADGHHRYTTALEYHKKFDGTEKSAYMMMFMLNMEDDGVTILPAHRVLKAIDGFDAEKLKEKLSQYFEVQVYPRDDLETFFKDLDAGSKDNFFGMYSRNGSMYLLKLKDQSVMDSFGDELPAVWRKMDVIILHSLILNKILGLDWNEYAQREDLIFIKERQKALDLVDSHKFQVAFFLNPTRMQQVKEAAKQGERMPQKSTYFYPKPLSGLVIHTFD
ncbi:MAG: DUF1015 domain-containing protein [Methanobacteriota archaeon]